MQGRHFTCEEALFRELEQVEQVEQRSGEVSFSGDIQIPALAVGLDDLQRSLPTLIIL